MARSASPQGDRLARVIGFLVFLLGLAVIVTVLWMAFAMWRAPDLGIRTTSAPGVAPDLTGIGVGFGRILVRIALLLLASICGSLIANKGIHLYFTGLGSPRDDKP